MAPPVPISQRCVTERLQAGELGPKLRPRLANHEADSNIAGETRDRSEGARLSAHLANRSFHQWQAASNTRPTSRSLVQAAPVGQPASRPVMQERAPSPSSRTPSSAVQPSSPEAVA